MKREMRSRYLWVQYEIADNPKLSGSDILVYMSLSRFVDNGTQTCFPSIKKLCETSRLSKQTVYDCIKNLEELKIISVDRDFGKVNHYCLLHIDTPETYTSLKNRPVQNKDTTRLKEGQVGVKNKDTNNTYINNTYITTEVEDKIIKFLGDKDGITSPVGWLNAFKKRHGYKKLPARLLDTEFNNWDKIMTNIST